MSEPSAPRAPCAPVDLVKLVHALIPAHLKRIYRYEITFAKTIPPDDSFGIAFLNMNIFRIKDSREALRTRWVLMYAPCDEGGRKLKVNFYFSGGRPEVSGMVTASLQSDLDAFEREFEKNARRELSNACDMIGNGAVIPYILLCMLVYTEHVFAPISDATVARTQRGAPHADQVREMLDRLWDVTDAPYYPFLARLMPVEFASTLNGACIK